MIDWDAPDPKPDFIASKARELRTVAEAVALLDEWQAAESEAWKRYTRLHRDYIDMKFRAEVAESMALNYQVLFENRAKF